MGEYLSDAQIDSIVDTVMKTLGYAADIRKILPAGLPDKFAAIMPGNAAGLPLVALRLDLGYLNTAGRLVDGKIPLKVWLQNVVKLAGATEDADPVREALADVEIKTTGAPRVAVTSPPAQLVTAGGPPIAKEKLVFRDDMVPFRFMEGGVEAARAVAKLMVPRYDGTVPKMIGANPMTYLGTGWLIGNGLLITNHHVLNARDDGEADAGEDDLRLQAAATTILFDFDAEGRTGTPAKPLDLIAWDTGLDYALIHVDARARKPLTLAPEAIVKVEDNTAIAVNIIQHPDGNPKRFGIRNNLVTKASETELCYFTDTLNGSSGSPVLNDLWQVVALHRGSAFKKGVRFQGREVPYVNVGAQIHAIIADLGKRFQGKLPELGI